MRVPAWLVRDLECATEAAAFYGQVADDAHRRGRDDTAERFGRYAAAASRLAAELEQRVARATEVSA